MNETLRITLLVLGILSIIILIATIIIFGAGKLNTHREEEKCDELEQKGFNTIIIDEGIRDDCRIVYKGVIFDSLESENILMLKSAELNDADHENTGVKG